MMKHTPGPWEFGKTCDSIIAAPTEDTPKDVIEWYGGEVVAETVSTNDKHLISAAPEMVKALKDLIMWYDDGVATHAPDCPSELALIWKSARKAVDKAKGWDHL